MNAERLLLGLIPLALEFIPKIIHARESEDKTLARRLLQEALSRQAFEEMRVERSRGAPE